MILRLLCVLILSAPVMAQVGINTEMPTATLDVNGNLKIRSIIEEATSSDVRDSIVVINGSYIKSVTSNTVVNLGLPTLVKGRINGTGVVNLSLLTGSSIIPFDTEDFDLNNEFDTSTYTFTAQQEGYYRVGVQIKSDPTTAISPSFGVEVLKNGTVVNRNTFANVGVAATNVTPPLRAVNTMVHLSANDTITFNVSGNIAMGSVNLLENFEDTFFSIEQVR